MKAEAVAAVSTLYPQSLVWGLTCSWRLIRIHSMNEKKINESMNKGLCYFKDFP